MTLPTHILLGAVIGKVTGSYVLTIGSSIAPDLDHFYSYVKSGVIKKPKQFWRVVIARDDPYGDQRGILHNLITIPITLVFSPIVALGWAGHLTLDALDNSEYWPLYPNKKIVLRGPIKYASINELVLFLVLLGVYFLI